MIEKPSKETENPIQLIEVTWEMIEKPLEIIEIRTSSRKREP
ncbi:hypothetical protein [Cytobacillus gottheilii]